MNEREQLIDSLMPKGFTVITSIEGLNGMYGINENGDIFSLRKMRLLTRSKHSLGYTQVYLSYFRIGSKGLYCKLHRLVANQFIPNPLGLSDVNHKNGIKDDNRVENLEWMSHRDNVIHSFKVLGRVQSGEKMCKQIKCSNGKIYKSAREASKDTGAYTSNISSCCNGKMARTKKLVFEFV
jgi:hypothetical protein